MYYTRVTNTDNRACVGEFHRGCAATCARSSLPDELEFLAADKILSRESCDAHHVSGSKSARVYECLASSGLNERHSGILVARRASDAAQDKSRRMINKNGGFRGRRVYIYIYIWGGSRRVCAILKKISYEWREGIHHFESILG